MIGAEIPSAERPWLDAAIVIGAFEALAVAIWLIPASVSIVQWPSTGPVRLALLAPTWQLAVLTAVAFGTAAAVLVWSRRWQRHESGERQAGPFVAQRSRLERLRSSAAPFLLLWLWAVPYLPGVGDRLPLLLVLAGPLRWLLLAIVIGAVLTGEAMGRRLAAIADRLDRRTVFAISLGVYLVLGLNSVRVLGLGGDEPHYLIITESLLRDGDLKIENNHRQRDYRSFYPRDLAPDYMQRGQDGAIYSIHPPGLPALLLPVYAVGGHRGAVAAMCLLAALTALAIFQLADALAGRRAAGLTWLAVCFTVPFMPYSWSIFPEMAGAAVVAWACLWLWRPAVSLYRAWFWRGLVLAALPWMHTKFAVFFAVFGAALAFRAVFPAPVTPMLRPAASRTSPTMRRQLSAAAALLTPMAISGGLWLYSFYAIYGSPDPEAPYGSYGDTYVLTRYIPHGLIGIFFDQKFGLLFYSPVYLLALAGAWILLRQHHTRYVGVTLLAAVGVFVSSTARLYMFWGGSSAPARFLVPILPCLAPMIAMAIRASRRSTTRALIGTWMGISLAVAIVGVGWPARLMLFSDPHGRARLLEMLQAGSPLALVVPTFTEPDWRADLAPLAWWLAAAVIALVVTRLAALGIARAQARRTGGVDTGQNSWRIAAIASLTFLLAGAALTARPAAAVRDATARRGALDVLWRFDGTRLRTFDYQALARATPERLRELRTVVFRQTGAPAGKGFVGGPIDLPPGAYEAVVWFESARPRRGDIVVSSSPRATFARLQGALANPSRVSFQLPVGVRRLSLEVPDPEIARAITEVQMVPVAVAPPGERPDIRARALESLPGRESAYLVYLNDEAYPEGGVFWTRGTATAQLLVAAAGASRITLTLSTGPMSGAVTVAAAGETRRVQMRADSEQTVSIDLPASPALVPLAVQSLVMFRPGEVDPTSGDMRGLGCHVRITLE